jgi:hypothetical protein
MGVNKAAENADISKLEIHSNYSNTPLDVSFGVSRLYYYESILDNTVRSTIQLADSGVRVLDKSSDSGVASLEEGSSLTAGEKVEMIIVDGYGQKITLDNDYHLRIKEVRNIVQDTKISSFTIDLYSKESIDNELVSTRVEKKYEGRISDSVRNILVKDCLKTTKDLDIDLTANKFNFWGNTEKPFYKLAWLASRSVPELSGVQLGITAGYFFYETYRGYKFKSIDKLFKQTTIRKLIFNNTTAIPLGYDGQILEYSFDSTVDIQNKLLTGSLFSQEQRTFDFYGNKYEGEKKKEFDASKQFENDDYNGGTDKLKLASDLKIGATKSNFIVKDIGIAPTGLNLKEQLKDSKKVNYDIDQIVRQSSARYNNLFTIKLSITIAGDFGLNAGDLVYCDFPEISDKENKSVSNRNSGIYMIVDLCHYINSNPRVTGIAGRCFTKLNLVRDTFGRKPF